MRIAMVPTLNAPVVHYRMENFVNEIRRQFPEHEIAYSYHHPDFARTCEWEKQPFTAEFIKDMDGIFRIADIGIFQVVHTQRAVALICALQAKYKKPILTEIDDDIYSVQSTSTAFNSLRPDSLPELWGDDQIRQSDGLICSTNYLKKIYTDKNPKIDVIQNCISFDFWDKLKSTKRKHKNIRIGWAGGATHDGDLNMVKRAILNIANKHKNVEFIFITGGNNPEFLTHPRIRLLDYHHWRPINKYPQYLKSFNFDISISPLRDTNFNRAKSHLKWLEFSALKVPMVASNVEPYRKAIEHGKTGFLCDDPSDFETYLDILIKREKFRRNMGQAAYTEVKQNHNLKHAASKYVDTLRRYVT